MSKKDNAAYEYEDTIEQGNNNLGEFMPLPSSPTLSAVGDILKYSQNLEVLKDRRKQLSHNATNVIIHEPTPERPTYGIETTTESSKTFTEITDINSLSKTNKGANKLLRYTLSIAKKKNIINGELIENAVIYPLDDLVETKAYSTRANAKRGFYDNLEALLNLKVGGFIYKKDKKNDQEETDKPAKKRELVVKERGKSSSGKIMNLIIGGEVTEDNECIIHLNPLLNWGAITQFFSFIPKYYMSLPYLASELLDVIFLTARFNVDKIRKFGYIDISLRKLQFELNLANEDIIKKPKRDIQWRLEEAIEQIEDTHKTHFPKQEKIFYMEILPYGIEKKNIKNYLDTGYLRVYFKGDFAKPFIAFAKQKNKKTLNSNNKKK